MVHFHDCGTRNKGKHKETKFSSEQAEFEIYYVPVCASQALVSMRMINVSSLMRCLLGRQRYSSAYFEISVIIRTRIIVLRASVTKRCICSQYVHS